MASPIPPSKTDDPEDVSWALTTAETQWSRGDKTEALKWLRRAADAASDAEADMRALELAKAAAELSTSLASGAATTTPKKTPPPPPATRKSVPPPAAGRASRPPKGEVKTQVAKPAPGPAKPAAPAAAKPAAAPVKPTAAKVVAPTAPKPVAAKTSPTVNDPKPDAKEDLRKTARKSYAGEVVGGRGAETESTETSEMQLSGTSKTAASAAPAVALDATSRSGMPTKPPEAGAHDPDSWPTETLSGDDLPIPTFEHERTRIGAAAYREARVERPGKAKLMQAVRVILYRAPDGSLRVAPEGTAVSAVAIEAMLVSLDPDVDLPSWLA